MASLEIDLVTPARAAGDLLVAAVFDGESLHPPKSLAGSWRASIDRLGLGAPGLASAAGESGQPTGSDWWRSTAANGHTVVVLGLGPRKAFEARSMTRWAERVLDVARKGRAVRLLVLPPAHPLAEDTDGAERTVVALSQAVYRFDEYRSGNDRPPAPKSMAVIGPGSRGQAKSRPGHRRGVAVAAAASFGRDLANTPPNVANPAWMAAQARALARRRNLRVTVLGEAQLLRRGMGGILAVGQGSANTPRLVRLRYGKRGPRVALVGKGVTFDTGGISIKPAASMEEMKFDKCGACTALAVTEAVARLRLPLRLDTYLPLAENMPGATAYRPSDIIRCYNGKSVEVINTDAEGRLILADALSWAAESGPDYLIEMSTLTGAAVVALGPTGAGLYAPDDSLATALLEAAAAAGERLWRMPLWSEFLDEMKGSHGDLKNAGSRWGGANTAAAFLSQFVGGVERWAHLDIAGPAYSAQPVAGGPSGATGFGVPFLVRWLRSLGPDRAS